MKVFSKIILTILFSTALSSCGALLSNDVDNYQLLSGSLTDAQDGSLSTTGNASIRFLDEDGTHARYDVTLSIDDGGSVMFALQANSQLNLGIEVSISRSGSTYLTDIEGQTNVLSLGTASDSNEIQLVMELDNQTPQLLIWTNGRASPAAASFDSDTDLTSALTAGAGSAWGVTLQGARLVKAKKTAL